MQADWAEVDDKGLRSLTLRAGAIGSFACFAEYFENPSLSSSKTHSFVISLMATPITVTLDFRFGYALHRTCQGNHVWLCGR